MKKRTIILIILLVLGAAWGIRQFVPPALTREQVDEKFDTAVAESLWSAGESRPLFRATIYKYSGPIDNPEGNGTYDIRALVSRQGGLDVFPKVYKNARVATKKYTQTIAGHDIQIEIVDPGTLLSSPGDGKDIVIENGGFQPFILLHASNDKGYFAFRITCPAWDVDPRTWDPYYSGEKLHPRDEAFVTYYVETYLFPEDLQDQ